MRFVANLAEDSMRFVANLIAKTFTGKTLDEIDEEQANIAALRNINESMRLRYAQLGFIFLTEAELMTAIQHKEKVRRLLVSDEVLVKLLALNQSIPVSEHIRRHTFDLDF